LGISERGDLAHFTKERERFPWHASAFAVRALSPPWALSSAIDLCLLGSARMDW
jgi:hypothetical protein